MSISIRAILHQYAATLTKTWAHDRSTTVGASEIGQCARKTWFDKHDVPRDAGYVDSFGGRLRGTVIENAYWVPGMRKCLPANYVLRYAGDEQETLVSGYLSATTDGLAVNIDTQECINLDCKSIDPRADLRKEKAEHTFQVQAQMGLIREMTKYKPTESIVSYIDASFWDVVTEFVVPFDARIYAQAHVRATQIMTAREAIALPPEGKMAGGDECEYCAWASHCADVTIAGVPREEHELTGNLAGELRELCASAKQLQATGEYWDNQRAQAVENIKQFLRDHNVRRHKGEDFSVSYSTVNGRETLDIQAVKDAGIDLTPYYKTGKPSERLTIK